MGDKKTVNFGLHNFLLKVAIRIETCSWLYVVFLEENELLFSTSGKSHSIKEIMFLSGNTFYFPFAGDALSLPARREVPMDFKERGHLSVTNVL